MQGLLGITVFCPDPRNNDENTVLEVREASYRVWESEDKKNKNPECYFSYSLHSEECFCNLRSVGFFTTKVRHSTAHTRWASSNPLQFWHHLLGDRVRPCRLGPQSSVLAPLAQGQLQVAGCDCLEAQLWIRVPTASFSDLTHLLKQLTELREALQFTTYSVRKAATKDRREQPTEKTSSHGVWLQACSSLEFLQSQSFRVLWRLHHLSETQWHRPSTPLLSQEIGRGAEITTPQMPGTFRGPECYLGTRPLPSVISVAHKRYSYHHRSPKL